MNARYTFNVRFRLEPDDVVIEPTVFETTLSRPADPPGVDGWLFFRDNLWRGDIADTDHFISSTGDVLGVPVIAVEYRAFITDDEYWTEFRDAIAANLGEFRAESVEEVITKYLGSSVERTG